ncbi:hypothetical protein C8R44DRAFT_58767 [Mycena epipterygia]|nr:hypothetical protein C8R44DRAFT_58767 [Mycena epipterygia]
MIAHSLLDFSRRPVSSIQTHKSALSAMASQRIPNPFAVVASMAEVGGGSLAIAVCFPHAKQPTGQLLDLQLPGNATVEDAIALALWTYWEKCWLPELDVSKARDTDIASWIMLVPGKDGVVNKRIAQSKMKSFNFDKYAIVRSPRNLSEKQKIQSQVAKFRRVSTPTVTVSDKRHIRQYSLPILGSTSKVPDAQVSFSKLP